jgi:small-conductance mechanosensitive channel
MLCNLAFSCNSNKIAEINADVLYYQKDILSKNYNFNYLSYLTDNFSQKKDFLTNCLKVQQKISKNITNSLNTPASSKFILLPEEKKMYSDMLEKSNQSIENIHQTLFKVHKVLMLLDDRLLLAKDYVDRRNEQKSIQQLLKEQPFPKAQLRPLHEVLAILIGLIQENFVFFILLMLSLISVGVASQRYLKLKLMEKPTWLKTFFFAHVRYEIVLIIPLVGLFLYLFYFSHNWLVTPPGLILIQVFWMLLFIKIALLIFICFLIEKKSQTFYEELVKSINSILLILFFVSFLQFSELNLFNNSNLPEFLYLIVVIPVFSILMFYFSYQLVLTITDKKYFPKTHNTTLKIYRYAAVFLIAFYLLFREGITYLGYQIFSTTQIFITIVFCLYSYKFLTFEKHFFEYLTPAQKSIWYHIKSKFELKKQESCFELSYLYTFLGLFLIYWVVTFILVLLTVPDFYIYYWRNMVFYQFGVNGLDLSIYNMIKSLNVFCGIGLLGRFFAYRLASRSEYVNNIDRQYTIKMTVKILFYGIAIIACIAMFGFTSSQIGFVLGGFTFALGLGLQFIIKDFVSGVIIFTNKAIRIGDLIDIVNDRGEVTAGIIKKISILSTQIHNDAQALMNIPNSQIIENCVVNYTFSESIKYCYIHVTLENIKDYNQYVNDIYLLLKDYPDVLQTPPHAPEVSMHFVKTNDQKNKTEMLIKFNIQNLQSKTFLYQEIENAILEKLKDIIYQPNSE